MNDTPSNQQVATTDQRPRRQVMIIEDVIPILDTARFEHMQRIATVMAGASMLPDYLKGSHHEGTFSNCFLIVNQAVYWNMDPFSAARAMFMLRGKLGYEGKLLIAALRSKYGIILDFEWFGVVGTDGHGIKVTGPRLGDNKEVSISGTVGDWKTFENDKDNNNQSSGKKVKGNWQGHAQVNQLAYRGTAEWVRLYAPSLTLGAYSGDEIEAMEEDQRGRNAVVISNEPDAPPTGAKPRGRPRKETDPNRMQEATQQQQVDDAAKGGDTIDAGTGEVIKEKDDPDAGRVDANTAKDNDNAAAEKKNDEPAAPPADAKKKAEPKDKPAPASDSKPADEHGAYLEELFGRIGPDAELKNAISKLDSLFTAKQSLAELRSIYDDWAKTAPKWTKTQDAFLLEFRKYYRGRVEGAAAAATAKSEPAAPPATAAQKAVFDYSSFLHGLEMALGEATSADEVARIFEDATSTALADGAITEEQMENDVRPLSVAAMDRFSFGN